MKGLVTVILLTLAFVMQTGCQSTPTVPPGNTTDISKPLLRLGSAGLSKDVLVDQNSTSTDIRYARLADEMVFVATAEDVESGIKSVTLNYTINVNCSNVGTNQNFSETQLAPSNNSGLPTRLSKSYTFKVAPYRARCASGRAMISLSIVASSENGAGLQTTLMAGGIQAVDTLKVATFNLHWPGNHPRSVHQRWAEQLGAQADVWILTEVHTLADAQFIGNAAGMPFVSMHPTGDIAIASRAPHFNVQHRQIDPPGTFTSGISNILSIETNIDGVAHQIIGTHWGIRSANDTLLCACTSDPDRIQAANTILALALGSTASAKFVAGDMNAYSGFGPQDHDDDPLTPDFVGSTAEVDLLRSVFVDPYVFLHKDNDSVCSNQRIDYVMVKGRYQATQYNARFCDEASPSDHPFVIATFEAFDL